MRALTALAVTLAMALTATGCSKDGQGFDRPAGAAVVVVSGGDATSPFTTNDQACATGLAAGNTNTAIRDHLISKGYTVYTSPAMAGRGQVVDQTGFGAFGVCPVTLPENMTVNSTGSIDTAGEHLARFVTWLQAEKGVTEVDFVAHSMGGLYSRAAIRVLASTSSTVKVRSLTTIGTPWQGSYLSDYANDLIALSACGGDTFCESAMSDFKTRVRELMAGSGREVNTAFLMGSGGWNEFQSGVLDQIPDEADYLLTVDYDGFDVTCCPAVSHPEPGGLTYHEGVALLEGLARKGRIVGMDWAELVPEHDHFGLTARTTGRLILTMIRAMAESGQIGQAP